MADNITLTSDAGSAAYYPSGTVVKTTQASDNAHIQHTAISDADNTVEIITGAVTGEKGLRVFIGDTDPISDLPVFVSFNQHQIHEGEAYHTQYVDTGLDTGTVKFGLTVPTYAVTIQAPHLVLKCDVYNGAAQVDIYEGATFTDGTAMTLYNRNRNSSNTPGMTIKSGVTSTDGTLIYSSFYGAGLRGADSGDTGEEWILKSNTIYRIDLTGLSAGTDAILHIEQYEDLGT